MKFFEFVSKKLNPILENQRRILTSIGIAIFILIQIIIIALSLSLPHYKSANKIDNSWHSTSNLTIQTTNMTTVISLTSSPPLCQLALNFTITFGLQNYWPFCSDVNDKISHANLYNGVNNSFTFDRFNLSLSALRLQNGYYKLPKGVYFNGSDYTVMAWIKIRNYNFMSRLLDIGNGIYNDNVVFKLSNGTSGRIVNDFYNSNITKLGIHSSRSLTKNKWEHVAFVFINPSAFIYIDGVLTARKTASGTPVNINRTSNFLGRSNWIPGEMNADADIDELKIFNRGLSRLEILYEKENNMFY